MAATVIGVQCPGEMEVEYSEVRQRMIELRKSKKSVHDISSQDAFCHSYPTTTKVGRTWTQITNTLLDG